MLNPPSTEHLYFVANGTGGHAFAATLEEHNRNVRQWRQIAGNAAAAVAAEEAAEDGAAAAAETAPPARADEVPAPDGPLAAVTEIVEPPAEPAAPAHPLRPPKPAAPAKPAGAGLAPGTIVVVEGRKAVIPRLRPAR